MVCSTLSFCFVATRIKTTANCIASHQRNIKICHLALCFQIVQPVSTNTNQVLTERQGYELIQNYCDDTAESRKVLESSVLSVL